MDLNRITDAAEAIGWLSEQAGTPGELASERLQMATLLTIARSYLVEYSVHVVRGMEPYDALVATARGDLKLSESQQDLLRALTPPREARE